MFFEVPEFPTDHVQQTVTVPSRAIQVDTELAGILTKLWGMGLYTFNSCQGRFVDGIAYIQFEAPWMALMFVNLLFPSEQKTSRKALAKIITNQPFGHNVIPGTPMEFHKTHFHVSVNFPASLIPWIEGELNKKEEPPMPM
jgi:hypothetical protein